MSDYQVVYRGIVHDNTGYAKAAREYILALDRAGIDVRVEPINFGSQQTTMHPDTVKRLNFLIQKERAAGKKQILIYHCQPYGVDPDFERNQNGFDKVLIYTVFEATHIPSNFFPNINRADGVIVPSMMNWEAFVNSGVTVPIFLVPHGVDLNNYNPSNEPFELPCEKDDFVFLSVFQWQYRKAPEILLRAFWEEFDEADNVALVIKTYLGANDEQSSKQIRDAMRLFKQNVAGDKETATVFVTTVDLSEKDMQGLYTAADCFVLPSRGEGVGLPYMEALASGIPVIAPNWGGHLDFCTVHNSYLVECTLEPTQSKIENSIAPDYKDVFTDEMMWAETDLESLKVEMRTAYVTRRVSNPEKGKQGYEDMQEITWDRCTQFMIEVIESTLGVK